MTSEEMKEKLAKAVSLLDVVAATLNSGDIDLECCVHGLAYIVNDSYVNVCDVLEALNEGEEK